mmetsp:Transcript_25632/g.39445  ORF Transcript_25632/g.39445 Transcript_25632/m.39445 type:complete len:92 (+) Transcript_25632:402-677(+)
MALAESESQDDNHVRTQSTSNPQVKKAKPAKKVRAKKQEENAGLYDAFHNRLFVDDCDLNVKIQALNQIQEMFKAETQSLQEMMKEEGKEE